MTRSKIYDFGKSELQRVVDESNSYADVLRKLGMSEHGGNRKTLNKVIDELDIDLTKISQNRNKYLSNTLKKSRRTVPLEDIITGKYKEPYNGNALKTRLIKAGYKEHKCENCGLTEWLGEPIPLEIHHENGDHYDNRLENIKLLCPNCHSLTDNFAGKNIKTTQKIKIDPSKNRSKTKKGLSEDGQRLYDGYGDYKILCPLCKKNFMSKTASLCQTCYKNQKRLPKIPKEEFFESLKELGSYQKMAEKYGHKRHTISAWHAYYIKEDQKNGLNDIVIKSDKAPSREILKKEIREQSFSKIGRKYGVNGNTIKEWCLRYRLPHLKRKIKLMTDEEWESV